MLSGPRLFVIVFIMLGLFCLAFGTSLAIQGIRASSWPMAKGIVIKSEVKALKTQEKIRIARLCFYIDYIYQVRDKVYEGHKISVGWQCFGSEDKIKRLLMLYPSGKKIQVYYNPKNPSQSLLQPGLDWTVFFLWGIGIVTLSVCWPLFRKTSKKAYLR